MDRYELKVSIDEIDALIAEHRFREAAAIADTIDWKKVKSVQLLCRISDLYKINKRYADSRDLLQMAYEKNPTGRKIIYSLCELELKLNNYIHALQLYNAFINVAPRDSDRYLLQYKLYKKQDVNVREQIIVLEEFLQRDFRERWAYELATLYLKAGEEKQCISQCDEIVTYFGDGRFVIRALELKKTLVPLTPQQEERLEILKSGGTIAPPAPAEETAEEPEKTETTETAESAGESAAAEAAENAGTELTETAEAAKEPAEAETIKTAEKSAAEEPAGARIIETAEKSAGEARAASAGRPEKTETAAGEEKTERTSRASRSVGPDGDTRPMPALSRAQRGTAAGSAETAASAETTGFTEAGRMPAGSVEDGKDPEDGDDEGEPVRTPEEYTDALLRDVKMQETIARGMREIDDYDSVLAQETSGQFAMVMEEDPPEETQVEGQLDLEQIMSEWEKIRRESEQQRLAQARRRVLERSEEAKRQLYGDTAVGGGAGSTGAASDEDGTGEGTGGTTRSWKREEVEKGLRKYTH